MPYFADEGTARLIESHGAYTDEEAINLGDELDSSFVPELPDPILDKEDDDDDDEPAPAVQPPRRSHYDRAAYQADSGIPNRFELFLLDDGQKKVESKEETRVPNTTVFTFNKEDHTLGNLLSQRLLKYDYVVFAAYKVPLPLFATFELRVSTDGSVTPKEAIIRACTDIVQDLQRLNDSFQQEWLGKKIVSEGEAERVAREQNNF